MLDSTAAGQSAQTASEDGDSDKATPDVFLTVLLVLLALLTLVLIMLLAFGWRRYRAAQADKQLAATSTLSKWESGRFIQKATIRDLLSKVDSAQREKNEAVSTSWAAARLEAIQQAASSRQSIGGHRNRSKRSSEEKMDAAAATPVSPAGRYAGRPSRTPPPPPTPLQTFAAAWPATRDHDSKTSRVSEGSEVEENEEMVDVSEGLLDVLPGARRSRVTRARSANALRRQQSGDSVDGIAVKAQAESGAPKADEDDTMPLSARGTAYEVRMADSRLS